MRLLPALLLLGCNAPASRFGVVTEDAKTALHDFCGSKLEIGSNMNVFGWPEFDNPNLLVYQCVLSGEDASLAIDTTNDKLWDLSVSVRSKVGSGEAAFDRLVDRVLLPSLDPEQRRGYDELRPTLSVPWDSSQSWIRGMTRISVYIVQYPQPGHELDASLMVVARYDDSRPKDRK